MYFVLYLLYCFVVLWALALYDDVLTARVSWGVTHRVHLCQVSNCRMAVMFWYSSLGKCLVLVCFKGALTSLLLHTSCFHTDIGTKDWCFYTVSGKKVTPCVLFYNSGTGPQILTKFCANNAASNSKQIAKFQWNLSTTATVIVVLVRAVKKWSVHYRQWHRQLTVIELCRWRNIEQ